MEKNADFSSEHAAFDGQHGVMCYNRTDQNKPKAFRRPHSHEVLLTGLLFCACGNKMYPKVSPRPDPEGGFQYTYVCSMKERRKKELCNRKNVRGNWIDRAIVEEIKNLGEDNFLAQLEQSKEFCTGSREDMDKSLASLQSELAQLDKKMMGWWILWRI